MRINQSMIEQQRLQMLRASQNSPPSTQQTAPRLLRDSVSFTQVLNESEELEAINGDDANGEQRKGKSKNRRAGDIADGSKSSTESKSVEESSDEAGTGNRVNLTA